MSSIAESTMKSYDIQLKKWWFFCLEKDINIISPQVPDVITFLTEQYEKGLSHSTINTIRSAISYILGENTMSQDYRMKRFFQGIANMRPSKPKYNSTWDPQIVLNYFLNQPDNKNLSLKLLSKKLITLLALVTGHRMQTLALIKINNIKSYQSKIEIRIPDKIKTSSKNKMQPLLVLPVYETNKKICAATALIDYMAATKDMRGQINALFVSLKKPVKAITKNTLSNWTKGTLKLSGIDTSIFSAHSTRSASTSAAKRLGINLEAIRKTAGWTAGSSTFAKFYDRDIISGNEEFALTILRNTKS